jgi:hypothetical protein
MAINRSENVKIGTQIYLRKGNIMSKIETG